MSALARLFLSEGRMVSGSDRAPSMITDALAQEGVTFYPAQVPGNLHASDMLPDLVVYTEAMPHEHPELEEARACGIPTINYFEALGLVANEYRLIAVAGSHGKTTTTAMLIDVLEKAGLDPSAVVGSLRAETKSNYRKGKSAYFIAEACEYRRDFLSLRPDVLVVTNIELEHVDYYKTLEDVQAAFCELVAQMREGGTLIANVSDPALRPVIDAAHARDLHVVDYRTHIDPLVPLQVPGLHNRMNAAAAAAAAAVCGVSPDAIHTGLAAFAGTWRRFEYTGEVNGAKIYDDYGHHPTEIAATIKGARELYPDRTLTVVFQAHTYTRMDALFHDFVEALALADRICILPIYAAREENTSGITHEALVRAIAERHTDVHAYGTFDAVVEALKPALSSNDVVLVMGAGDITAVARLLTA
jgi:UDP-N-acetylmuramate--alanine ligase